MPQPELKLWYYIRNKQLGIKFRRQYVVDNRILDFYSPEIKLGIEIDGDSHFLTKQAQQKDIQSDIQLSEEGIKILRFTNIDIKESLDGVIGEIKEAIDKK